MTAEKLYMWYCVAFLNSFKGVMETSQQEELDRSHTEPHKVFLLLDQPAIHMNANNQQAGNQVQNNNRKKLSQIQDIYLL